jgi:hypothetical protein
MNGKLPAYQYRFYYQERLKQSIPESPNGIVLLKCPFCSQERKLKINLVADYWVCPDCDRTGNCFSMETMITGCDPDTATVKVMEIIAEATTKKREIAAAKFDFLTPIEFHESVHIYEDQFRLPALRVTYQTLLDGTLEAKYFLVNSDGQRQYTAKNIPTRLYRLPKVLSSSAIIITDSEPATDALAWAFHDTPGWAVTCWPQPIALWQPSFTNYFLGKKVLIIPENTEASRSRLQSAADALVGVAAIVKLVTLPDAVSVHDFVEQKSKIAATELLSMFESAPLWEKATTDAFPTKTAAELMESTPQEQSWLVDGLLPSDGFGLLVGPQKRGKSTLARQLAVAVADGEEFLGRKVIQGEVLYISLEETEANCIVHLKKLGLKNTQNVRLYGSAPTTNQLKAVLKQYPIKLVVLDTLFKCVHVKAVNDYVTVLNALQPILETAHEAGAHVLGIHHMNQMGGTLGSMAIEAATDVNVFFDRDGEKGLIWTEPRYGEKWEKTTLVFDKERQRYSLGKPQHIVHRQEMAAEMLKFIQNNPGSSQPQIFDSVEGRRAEKFKAFELIRPNLEQYGTGRHGDPFRYHPKKELQSGSSVHGYVM